MTISRSIRVLRAVGVALVPAVLLCCCADRAAAGCGEYVTIVGPDGKAQPPADHGKGPCHGPNCSGAPEAPAPMPSVPVTPAPVVKGLAPLADGRPGLGMRGRIAPPDAGAPVRLATSIYHPPRAS